jgi:hypothetical protein
MIRPVHVSLPGRKRGGAKGFPAVGHWFLCAGLFLVLHGCGATGGSTPPGEKQAKPGPRSSTDRLLVGTGCVQTTGNPAEDRLSADELARAEVAKQIEVKVVQVVEDIQKEVSRGAEAVSSYAVSVQTREMVDRNLKGVTIVERTTDETRGLTCSQAVLDKAVMARRIREDLDRMLAETETYRSSADKALGENRAADALHGYARAMMNLPPAEVEAGLLRDLGYRPPPIPSRAEFDRRWNRTLQGIRISVEAGDRQKARPGSPLPSPLKLRALQQGKHPVANLPLAVLRSPGKLDMQHGAQTDETGTAEFLVFRVPPGKKALQEIVIGLDWEKLVRGEGGRPPEKSSWEGWDARETVFTYLLPVPADFRVGVAVYDQSGKAMSRTPVQTALLEGLQRAGFVTRDILSLPGAVKEGFVRRPTLPEARRLLKGKVDILVLADFHMGDPRKSSYDFVFCRSRMIVQGIDLSSGRTLVSLDVSAKGGGLDRATAIRKSSANLGKKLRDESGEKLARALP